MSKIKTKVTLESEDGIYEGEAIDGVPNGYGKFTFTQSGDVYEGMWVDNAQTGKGKYTWGDGEVYEGDFSDNMRHGFGVTTNLQTKCTYEGEYRNNAREGKGVEKTPEHTYDGEWHDDLRHGHGKITFKDGSYHDGEWKNDKRTGRGYWRMSDGNVYEGEFLDSKPHGKGEYRWADGAVFMGFFKDGQRHGEGIERLANGDWLAGTWIKNVHDGKQRIHRRGDENIKIFTQTIRGEATSPQQPQVPASPALPDSIPVPVTPTTAGGPNTVPAVSASGGLNSTVSGFEDPNMGVPFSELAKNVTIGRLLGKGSFGSVYEAILPNGRVVALKVIELGSITNSENEMAALKNEISLLSKFNHKNIVRLEGCVEDKENNKMCIYMEYVAGGTLNSFMKKFPKGLPKDIIKLWTVQILAGVAYLHDQNVVHRDIKGDNILAGNDGVVKLADFGCSRSIDNLCSKTHGCRSMVGTPYWMAPEVIKDDSSGYGPKADVWSIGCTVVEMLTGKPPWPEFNSMWTAIYHIANSTGLPSEIPKDLPAEVNDFLLKTFERDPTKRPGARELLQHPWLKDTTIKYGIT
eukprot:PhF_6_TR14120/c0_g1_i1/m.22565